MTRKIIQIAPLPEDYYAAACVFALCDDGTIWRLDERDGEYQEWSPLPPITQEEAW